MVHKRYITTVAVSLSVLMLTAFSLFNAVALAQQAPQPEPISSGDSGVMIPVPPKQAPALPKPGVMIPVFQQQESETPESSKGSSGGVGQSGPTPQQQQQYLCDALEHGYAESVASTQAKGLSNHMTQAEINANIRSITDERNRACTPPVAPLTTALQLCTAARANYNADVQYMQEDGLSRHLNPGAIRGNIRSLRENRDRVCIEARAYARAQQAAHAAKRR